MSSPLFRPESSSGKSRWLGEIVLIRPLSFTFFAIIALIFSVLSIAFIITVDYTSKVALPGQLLPEEGVIQIDAPQTGIVISRFTSEGKSVSRNEVLYVLSSDHESSLSGGTQKAISDSVRRKQLELEDQYKDALMVQQTDRAAIHDKINFLEKEENKLHSQLNKQQQRRSLASEVLMRRNELVARGFFSREAMALKEADLLDQDVKFDELQRSLLELQRETEEARSTLSSLTPKSNMVLSELRRSISASKQELFESEAKREYKILAPKSGVSTTVTAEVGQIVQSGHPLMSIVPKKSKLRAILFAQSKDVGFIAVGSTVRIRYDSFAYTRFGRGTGTVISMSQTARLATDTDAFFSKSSTNNEPVYRIVVELNEDSVIANGKRYQLHSGMLVTGDVLQETRKIYQWILDPAYAASASVQ